jgi:phosphatidylserine/phosphatidylglycerophosphate/cardiolipin synthase-like enzyme
MAKYLKTSGISASLEEIISDARERLYIISPYLKLSDSIKERLSDKEREKVEVRIIFGKQELNPSEMSFLQNLKYARLYFSKNLHAKCYLNENKMVITSMNLYEFSQQNNREMGILIDRSLEEDKKIYDDAWKDIDSIFHNAEDFAYKEIPKQDVPKASTRPFKKDEQSTKPAKVDAKLTGFCIRTGIKIHFNPDKPLSAEAYKSWSKYSDSDYPEKFCHLSGEPSKGETSVSKPILRKNWSKAKELMQQLNN